MRALQRYLAGPFMPGTWHRADVLVMSNGFCLRQALFTRVRSLGGAVRTTRVSLVPCR